MKGFNHFVDKNGHLIMIATVVIISSIVSMFVTRRENFFASTSSSVIAPDFDFNKKLEALQQAQPTTDKNVVRETLLLALAQEHIPMIVCAFHDLITGPERAQRPQNIDEGAWLQKIWADLMNNMGIQPEIYMSVLQLRYSWFTETKDSFDTFQTKLEPNFIRDTLKRYIDKQGNFVPSSVDKYNAAMNCKLYRQFNRAANLTYYMTQSPTTGTSSTTAGTSSTTVGTSSTTGTSSTATNGTSSTTTGTSSTTTGTSSTATGTSSTTPTSSSWFTSKNISWIAPSSFIPMCLENKWQCSMFVLVIIVALLSVAAIIISILKPVFVFGQQSTQAVQPIQSIQPGSYQQL